MKKKIFVIDDDPLALQMIEAVLKAEGYEVRSAISGELALHAATAQPPELILLDISMPEMDGLQAAQIIRAGERRTQGKQVPIIAITEALNFPLGILDGGDNIGLDNFFANYQVIPGGTMIDLPIWNSPNWTTRSPATMLSLKAQPVVLMSQR